jgi:RimJ/RimL family protein N-acetyltransferase
MADTGAHELLLRRADLQDSGFLWRWRNDPETRRYSLNSEQITWHQHRRWFAEQLMSPAAAIYILENPLAGPIAQARYTKRDATTAEVHVTVSPAARGQGAGTRILRESATDAMRSLTVVQVVATITLDNERSLRAFKNSGYVGGRQREVAGRQCVELTFSRHARAQDS